MQPYHHSLLKRLFDIALALIVVTVFGTPFLLCALLIKLTSPGPVLYWSDRVGKENRLFRMPKLRTMRIDTPAVATHLLKNPEHFLTPIGAFLRRSSLDEIPQVWCILTGEMSFIGPRPALFNQDDLIKLRTDAGVHHLTPGLTGWAQVNGRDELPIPVKVTYDIAYQKQSSFLFDIRILYLTLLKVLNRSGISH